MTPSPSTTSEAPSVDRPVLRWRADPDESDVSPNVDHAAQLLGVEPDAVVAAIRSGRLVNGWFVDWQVDQSRAG